MTSQRKRLYQLLNIGWRQLAWSEDYYREVFLVKHGASGAKGKISATTLSDEQLEAALLEMKKDGFTPWTKRGRQKPSGSGQGNRPASADQVQLIDSIWADLVERGEVRSSDPAAFRRWLLKNTRRMHPQGAGWSETRFLTRRVASKVIEQLKLWQGRVNR